MQFYCLLQDIFSSHCTKLSIMALRLQVRGTIVAVKIIQRRLEKAAALPGGSPAQLRFLPPEIWDNVLCLALDSLHSAPFSTPKRFFESPSTQMDTRWSRECYAPLMARGLTLPVFWRQSRAMWVKCVTRCARRFAPCDRLLLANEYLCFRCLGLSVWNETMGRHFAPQQVSGGHLAASWPLLRRESGCRPRPPPVLRPCCCGRTHIPTHPCCLALPTPAPKLYSRAPHTANGVCAFAHLMPARAQLSYVERVRARACLAWGPWCVASDLRKRPPYCRPARAQEWELARPQDAGAPDFVTPVKHRWIDPSGKGDAHAHAHAHGNGNGDGNGNATARQFTRGLVHDWCVQHHDYLQANPHLFDGDAILFQEAAAAAAAAAAHDVDDTSDDTGDDDGDADGDAMDLAKTERLARGTPRLYNRASVDYAPPRRKSLAKAPKSEAPLPTDAAVTSTIVPPRKSVLAADTQGKEKKNAKAPTSGPCKTPPNTAFRACSAAGHFRVLRPTCPQSGASSQGHGWDCDGCGNTYKDDVRRYVCFTCDPSVDVCLTCMDQVKKVLLAGCNLPDVEAEAGRAARRPPAAVPQYGRRRSLATSLSDSDFGALQDVQDVQDVQILDAAAAPSHHCPASSKGPACLDVKRVACKRPEKRPERYSNKRTGADRKRPSKKRAFKSDPRFALLVEKLTTQTFLTAQGTFLGIPGERLCACVKSRLRKRILAELHKCQTLPASQPPQVRRAPAAAPRSGRHERGRSHPGLPSLSPLPHCAREASADSRYDIDSDTDVEVTYSNVDCDPRLLKRHAARIRPLRRPSKSRTFAPPHLAAERPRIRAHTAKQATGVPASPRASKQYLHFDKALVFARSLGLANCKEWLVWSKSGARPDNVPCSPDHVWKGDGWQGWGHWLGTTQPGGSVAKAIVAADAPGLPGPAKSAKSPALPSGVQRPIYDAETVSEDENDADLSTRPGGAGRHVRAMRTATVVSADELGFSDDELGFFVPAQGKKRRAQKPWEQDLIPRSRITKKPKFGSHKPAPGNGAGKQAGGRDIG